MTNDARTDAPLPTEGTVSELSEPLSEIVSRAVSESATDIHIDTWARRGVVRFRIDGLLHDRDEFDYDEARRVINQVKVAAGLDLAAGFEPLEGHFRWLQDDRYHDVRATVVSTAPDHEAAHMRLLTPPDQWSDIATLGIREEHQEIVQRAFGVGNGLVLVCGAAGSGKTTTLYTFTGLTDLRGRIAASVEDPAEYDLPYVRQLEVNEKHGVTMELGLETILRIDPDVILVGEIRDRASARVAARAALAGRLVMATIHARDAAGAIEAMHYLSVPYYILGAALRLVVAQDLVRKICPECAQDRPPEPHERETFEQAGLDVPETIRVPRSCSACLNSGYQGRTGVFEVAAVDEPFGSWLSPGRPQHEIRDRLRGQGAQSLATDALRKVAAGVTGMAEIYRFVDQ